MKKTVFIIWSIISFLAFVNVVIFDLFILFGSEELRVQFMPDDAYYYLQLAKNFVKLGDWTFDFGLSQTSGFHPLLAYLLALLYWLLQPDTKEFVVLACALSSILTICLAGCIWVRSFKQQNSPFLIFFTLCVGAQSFLINSVSATEWSIVIVLLSIYCITFYKTTNSPKKLAALFLVGCLLSLARTDTGLFPFALFIASLAVSVSKPSRDRYMLANSFSGLAGAITGLGLAFLNNYLFTGNFVQSSAQMKHYWSKFGGSSLGMTLTLPLRAIGFDVYFQSPYELLYGLPYFFLYLLLLLLILRLRRYHSRLSAPQKDPEYFRRNALFLASIICIIGYVIVYTYDGVVQNWYTANFILPLVILGTRMVEYLQYLDRERAGSATIVFSLIVFITFIVNIFSTYPVEVHAPWPHQQVTLEAGKYLGKGTINERVGAWNSGIIGYYQGGTVVNIDGLVNNDIYPYAVTNSLPRYLEERDIQYIVDFQLMFSPGFRQRGGYDDPNFLQKLKPVITFDQGQFPPWQFLTIYQIGD